MAAAGLAAGSVDRVLMNPPFRDERGTTSRLIARRRLAHAGKPGLLRRWIDKAAWLLKPGGVLTLIWRADGLDEVLALLAPAFGGMAALPVRPRDGAEPIRVLVRAVKGVAGPPSFRPALVLNDVQNRPSAAAEAVLRARQALKPGRGLRSAVP